MKKIFRNIRENYKLILVVLITGLFLGWLFFHPSEAGTAGENQGVSHEHADHPEAAAEIWTCSMHPQIRQDQPGQCPICGMDLIPLKTMQSGGEQRDPDEIMLTGSAAKLAEIQTAAVRRGIARKTWYLQGKVQADERNMEELTARFGGRIEKLYVNFTGQMVEKGEKLASIYSPDLVTAQKELLEAVSTKESRPAFYTASKAKLKLWDLTDEQIKDIEEKGEPLLYFDVLSPISGTVMMRHVAPGDYVKEGSALFQVSDLRQVWVMLDAYESDLPWIRVGDEVKMTFQALPGSEYEGKVSYIDPFIDARTRIAKVRIELPNNGLKLKPEMFVNAVIHSEIPGTSDQLLIPKSSVLWTGKRAVVYVKEADRESPTFTYRQITLGPEAGNSYLVMNGLREGEEIAVHGVFKIDAAAQLEGKNSMMNPPVEVREEFKQELQGVYESYLLMTEAFVGSDAGKVAERANEVRAGLQKVDMELLEGESHQLWMKYLKELEVGISRISGSSDISAQRLDFAGFNDTFYSALKAFGLPPGTIYYQYCPMANGDAGAYWFSNQKDIINPYFGDVMLHCGETRETIEFN